MAEGWKQGLGKFSKVEWDKGWGKNFRKNAEENYIAAGGSELRDTNPGGIWGALPKARNVNDEG